MSLVFALLWTAGACDVSGRGLRAHDGGSTHDPGSMHDVGFMHDAGPLTVDAVQGSDGSGLPAVGGGAIVPERLVVMPLPGGAGVLEVVALTLRAGPEGAELYAAVRNTGEQVACSAALSVELFDRAEQPLGTGIGGLLTQRFYRLRDGSDALAACIGPGDVSMTVVGDLPAELAVDDVAFVVYRSPYFALEVTAVEGLVITELSPVVSEGETTYVGTLENHLDVTLGSPSVTVFPLSRAGRPLGVAVARGAADLAPGEHLRFETGGVAAAGVDHAAYPAGALRTGP